MGWLVRAVNSSIGGKFVTAVTGLALMAFLVGHLSGNLLVYKGPDAFNAYAKFLHDMPALLWTARIGLLAAVIAHIVIATRLNLRNLAARPVPYAHPRQWDAAPFPSRTMLQTGMMILLFILYHLAHFTFGVTDPGNFTSALAHDPADRLDAYRMLVNGFQMPLVSGLYIFAMILLGLHLWHGASSVFQTLGLNHPRYNPLFRGFGPVFAVAVAGGFISIPVCVLLGIVK